MSAAVHVPDAADVIVLAAMTWEARPVLRALRDVRREYLPGCTSWYGSAGPYRVRVLRTGIGQACARTSLARAGVDAEGGRPAWVVSTGCAGALAPHLVGGDLVAATGIVNGAGDLVYGCRAHADVLVAWAEHPGLHLHLGPFLSVAEPLRDVESKRLARERTAAIAVEMEGAATATAALAAATRLLAVRAILDAAGTAIPSATAPRRHPVARALGLAREAGRSLGTLVAGQRAAQRSLEIFFSAFFADGAGVAAIDG